MQTSECYSFWEAFTFLLGAAEGEIKVECRFSNSKKGFTYFFMLFTVRLGDCPHDADGTGSEHNAV